MKIVAELGLAHEGSLGTALRMVDACAVLGADSVKFQSHLGDPVDRFRVGTWFPQDDSRQDYWKRTLFSARDWRKIRKHCADMGVEFGVSVFSFDAFCEMKDVGVDWWKVGSAQVSNCGLLSHMNDTGLPIVLSSGMSDWGELDTAVKCLNVERLTILQCHSAYPSKPEHIGLNVMHEFRRRYGCDVGLSDHSGEVWPGVVAAYLGANMLEVHFCLSEWAFGPDVKASLNPADFGRLVSGVRFVEQMEAVDKNDAAAEMDEMRRLFRCT